MGIITLLRSALTGEALSLPSDFDLDKAVHTFQQHHLIGLAIQGAVRCGFPRNHTALVRMTAQFCELLQFNRLQMQQLQKVYAFFEENGIDYLPVKGSVIKSLYDRPEYRVMFDADILIRAEQYPTLEKLLPSLSFVKEDDCEYEHTWNGPSLKLELHRYLVSSNFKNYFEYYRDSWRLARKNESGFGYYLSPEDHFVYLIVHLSKHYLNGTICAKDICDLQVWRKTYPDMDETYILREIDCLQLRDFYHNINELLNNWFEGAPSTSTTELITRSALQGSIYEEYNRSVVDMVMQRHSHTNDTLFLKKIKWFLHAVFPSYERMSYTYPVVKKTPVLLPLFWAVRWCHALFRDHNKLKRGMIVMNMEQEHLTDYNSHMAAIGLNPDEQTQCFSFLKH